MAFSESHCTASVPTQLELPTRFTAISCGRIHATALDSKHRVWIFNRWGRPNLLTFTGTLEDQRRRNPLIANTKIIQVACGYYSFVAFLTDDGRVFISWTTDREFLRQDTAMNTALDEADNGVSGRLVSGVIKCAPIPIDVDATLIPELPSDLPKLHNPEGEDDDDGRAPKIVKIAAGRAFIVALTDQGHVLRFDLSGGIVPEDVEELKNDIISNVRQWTYLPQLCEIEDVKEDPNFRPEVDGQPITVSQQDFKITHVSAHMDSAVVYSTGAFSTVIVAGMTMVRGGGRHMQRTILPELQNKNIISVTASEYHYAALDTNGTVYTWGTDLCGSLGLGLLDRTADGFPAVGASVSEPTPVQIHPNNPGRRTFCFSLTAAGWHTAALGFDLDDHCDPMEGPVSSPEQPVASTSQRQSSWRFWKR
ncbi:hypothetical protein FRC03_011940 [Tulasnella sp. 419]|nr:hypothetical protein FRC03_011940 [Tulasnella sp. 419]